jgi:hypothetical protein
MFDIRGLSHERMGRIGEVHIAYRRYMSDIFKYVNNVRTL